MVKKYIPKFGDVVYIDLNPTKGHEQKGKRPAVVISNDLFNIETKMVILCPISSNTKYFPTHYILEDTKKIKGSVFCEHIRSIDYIERKISFIEKLSNNDLMSIVLLTTACIENDVA